MVLLTSIWSQWEERKCGDKRGEWYISFCTYYVWHNSRIIRWKIGRKISQHCRSGSCQHVRSWSWVHRSEWFFSEWRLERGEGATDGILEHRHFRSGGWETSEVNAGGRHNTVRGVKNLREGGRLIDGGELEVMQVARAEYTPAGGIGRY